MTLFVCGNRAFCVVIICRWSTAGSTQVRVTCCVTAEFHWGTRWPLDILLVEKGFVSGNAMGVFLRSKMDTNVKVIWSTEEIEYFMNLNESVTLQPATVSWILVLEIIDDLSSAGASLTDGTQVDLLFCETCISDGHEYFMSRQVGPRRYHTTTR